MEDLEQQIPIRDDGVEFLKDVARQSENTTGLVFHGSKHVLSSIEPKPVYWTGKNGLLYDDSDEPVVCASDMPFIPTFMALAPRGTIWGYVPNSRANGLTYHVEQSPKMEFLQAVGYVMVLSAQSFHETVPDLPKGWAYDLPVGGRQPEMRSIETVIPLYAIKVSYADFEELLEIEGNSDIEYR